MWICPHSLLVIHQTKSYLQPSQESPHGIQSLTNHPNTCLEEQADPASPLLQPVLQVAQPVFPAVEAEWAGGGERGGYNGRIWSLARDPGIRCKGGCISFINFISTEALRIGLKFIIYYFDDLSWEIARNNTPDNYFPCYYVITQEICNNTGNSYRRICPCMHPSTRHEVY